MGGCWECLGSLDQPARERLVMDVENPADRSHPHPFKIELTGLLLEGWILLASRARWTVRALAITKISSLMLFLGSIHLVAIIIVQN